MLVAKVIVGIFGMFLFVSPHPVKTLTKFYRRVRGRP
jgi:hypothetical protein